MKPMSFYRVSSINRKMSSCEDLRSQSSTATAEIGHNTSFPHHTIHDTYLAGRCRGLFSVTKGLLATFLTNAPVVKALAENDTETAKAKVTKALFAIMMRLYNNLFNGSSKDVTMIVAHTSTR